MSIRRLSTVLALFFGLFASGCTHLPHEMISASTHGQIEYSLIHDQHTSPVVVFENGLDAKMRTWHKIIPEISKEAATFAYNRPGYGESEPASTPRDGAHIVEELRAFLKKEGVNPPYLLVGHSFGGLYMQLFARKYPDEVSGMLLVDSTHPEHFKGEGAIDKWPAALRTAFLWYLSSTARQEFDLINPTGEDVLALPAFTQKPVIVLSALEPMKERSALADDANAKRKDLVNLYPGAKQVWVQSGHNIPEEKPESIITAIREMLYLNRKEEAR